MDKASLRQLLTQRLASVDDAKIVSVSQTINERLKSAADWLEVRSVFIYAAQSKWREVDVTEFITWLTTAHPELKVGVAPISLVAPIPSDGYDVIITPLLGFDESCHRLGRGAGWYDRFLARQDQATKIGVGLEMQRVDTVLSESHDISLDIVLTEQSAYKRHKSTS